MKIIYLKDAPLGRKGEIATVQAHEAQVLITLGFAELVEILNLNGSPVVDDFGNLALVKPEPAVILPKTEVKTGKKGK